MACILAKNSTVNAHTPNCRGKTDAFTLVELSIVIVIMGLLVAATMAGSTLLNTSKLRSLIGEIESYKIAVDNFRGQYEALPGDMKNATSFWTTAQNGGVVINNGNGDGSLGSSAASNKEPYYAWNHLTLAKLIPGTFPGNSTAGATIGVNIPASKYISNVGFGLTSQAWNSYVDAAGNGFPGSYLLIGMNQGTNRVPINSGFISSDAAYVDSKIDDGTPDFGKVFASTIVSGTCTSGSAPNIIYDNTQTVVGCVLLVNIGQ